ncbi:MAG: hypothetical protein AAFY25_06700 [Pseudomonadota bacterium]
MFLGNNRNGATALFCTGGVQMAETYGDWADVTFLLLQLSDAHNVSPVGTTGRRMMGGRNGE